MSELIRLDPPRTEDNIATAAVPRQSAEGIVGALLQKVMLLVPALWVAGYLFPPLNHDAALILDVAARWIDGQRLYVDIIDVNPPLIFLLSALPVLISKASGLLDAPTAFILLLAAGIAGSLALVQRLLDIAGDLFGPVSRQLLLPLMAFLLAVYPDDMFGQREHIMLIASMPYVTAAALRIAGIPLRLNLLRLVMLFAGLGFALKPHFLLAPALIEMALIVVQRRFDWRNPALWHLAAIPFGHALFILLVTPEYVSEVIPMAFRQYAEQADAMWDVATGGLIAPTIAALVPFAGLAAYSRRMPLQKILALFVLATAVAAVVQAKGWSYQSLPATGGCLLLVFSTLAVAIDRYLPQHRSRRSSIALAGLLLLVCYYHNATLGLPFRPQREYAASETKHLLDIVKRESFDHKLLIISPGVLPHFPMVNYAQVQLVMRFESMWLLQGLYGDCHRRHALYNRPEDMTADERRIFEGLVHDFARERPSVLIIDRDAGIPTCGQGEFDYLDYFGRNPEFTAAFEGYEEIATFDRYRIYKRRLGMVAAEPHEPVFDESGLP